MIKHLAICLSLLMGVSIARASLIIDVGNISLAPGTPGQKVPIYVHGGDGVIQAQLRIQIAGGGLAVPGQFITGPTITSVDMLTGTIFDSNNNGQSPDFYDCVLFPQLASCGTMTRQGAVSAEGLLAIITVDTSNCPDLDQEYSLELKDTVFVNSPNTQFNGGDVLVDITNGAIIISSNVPEPATGLLALAGVGMLLRRRPRRATR
jgi:MYXO-CTERM domain-containing protein